MRYSYLRHLALKTGAQLPDTGPIKMMSFDELLKFEHTRRLLASITSNGKVPSWEGIRWVLDLLPHFPRPAIDALDAYILAHAQLLPDGRFSGLSQAVAIIRARFIQTAPNDAGATLLSLTSREFEFLVERLFAAMGYDTEITKATRDGGKDVIAVRSSAAMREKVLVECKLYDRSEVGFAEAMRLLGVITKEAASRGVIVTTGHVTDGATTADPRIEVVGPTMLFQLLNEHLGNRWPQHVDRIVLDSMRVHGIK
jgi:restriction system protein